MKYLIASDIHGCSLSCKKMLEIFEKEKCDKLILLGDLLYHGPRNDLPMDYDVREVSSMLNKYADKIMAIRGNCDADVDCRMFDFPLEARYMMFNEGGKTYFATHGDRFNTGHLPPFSGVDVLLHGHYHVPACENHIDYYYINPGSISIPKEGSKKSCIILLGNHLSWFDIETKKSYLETDI